MKNGVLVTFLTFAILITFVASFFNSPKPKVQTSNSNSSALEQENLDLLLDALKAKQKEKELLIENLDLVRKLQACEGEKK